MCISPFFQTDRENRKDAGQSGQRQGLTWKYNICLLYTSFDAPGRIIEFGNAGYLVPLDDMLDELKSDLTSDSLVDTCVGADGTAWMYPISSSPFYMGLNKEALEKADALQYVNLEGDRTWTTDNFVKMCEALRDARCV